FAFAAGQPFITAPELRVASPFSGSVWQMDADRNERYLVVSTAEGTAALFDLHSSPRKFDTFRLAMRDRQRTRGVGVAISADGGMIAIAAPPLTDSEGKILFGTGAVRVFTNGFMRGTKFAVPTGPDGVNGLAIPTRAPKLKFSPDGAYLVALLSYGCGVRVWD